ncbi:N-acetyltransferase family protein [Sedimenticola sp.]|uniref:GNAT family N-acetyltransferase n=1 Tax=Sedimenticola sp. TaxID=1940285 RepID=UPI003D09C077
MKIRFATMEDIPVFVEIGSRFHAISRFANYDYNAQRVADSLRSIIGKGQDDQGTHCFFVAENSEGEAVGALIGCVEKHLFSEQSVASVIQYGVLPEKRMGGAGMKLLAAFRKWAENRNAFELSIGVTSGMDMAKTDRLLRRLGFQQTGGNYSLSISNDG